MRRGDQTSQVREPLASIVIPAHNEAEVIGRCLDALFTGVEPGELEVIVVCNGCVDETAALARSSGHPVRVIELQTASKATALREGDMAARTFPRLYLDADVVLSGSSARKVAERLNAGAVAARPPVVYSSGQSSAPVRRLLPRSFEHALPAGGPLGRRCLRPFGGGSCSVWRVS